MYGIIIHMKKTMNIDAKLLKEAKAACGATTDTDAVPAGPRSPGATCRLPAPTIICRKPERQVQGRSASPREARGQTIRGVV